MTTPEAHDNEGRAGVGRVEAFSDGVIAIIITIMVLDLHAPSLPGLREIVHLWPTLLAYSLSYSYVAVYWVNHHRLFSYARVVTGGLLWSNILLLFSLSFIPFAAAYLGRQQFSVSATVFYLVVLLHPAAVYSWLQWVIRRTGSRSEAALAYHRATTRKSMLALAIYALGIPLTFIAPWLGMDCAALVAAMWMLPWSPLDRLFLGRGAA